MKYADDPKWVRIRWVLFILFWLVWLAMLVVSIVIIIYAPKVNTYLVFFCAKITLYVRPYVRPILHLTYNRIFRCSALVPPSIAFILDF